MDRRQAIKVGIGLGALGLMGVGLTRPAFLAGTTVRQTGPKRRMPVPRLIEAGSEPVELTMQSGRHSFLIGSDSPTAGFNGPYLGPTLRVRDGVNVPLVYRNQLTEAVAIHGHGLHVPGAVDGGPQREVPPGGEWAVELPIRQEACTSWFHPHTHGKTGPQTHQGLAALMIIEDENSQSLPLPSTYGIDDLPVVVQDRIFDRRGEMVYSIDDPEDGFMGDTVVVNGIVDATREVPAGLVRLRLLNASNARYYRFRFADGRVFHKIATDGGFLDEPVPVHEVVMVPGERNEIVVDFSDGRGATLVSGPASGDSAGRRGGRWEPGGLRDSFQILELTVDASLPAHTTPLPTQLNSIDRPIVQSHWRRRRFEMFMGGDGRRRDSSAGLDNGMMMGINGRAMDMAFINERVSLREWEVWDIRSRDGSHPFHVHGCSFLLLSREGRPIPEEDRGWKDTVQVDDQAEFIVRFEHEATAEYPYMYHCHILEHEDRGMMGQFTVT